MSNYFNSLPLRTQLQELGKCRFMDQAEFEAGVAPLAGKKLVIIGCGAQGFNQGLNLRDSGLNVAYALRKKAIEEKRPSWVKATEAGFLVGTYEETVPDADMV
ncbi:MAG: ketol-acid reductoisomerase, partial [Pseudomonadota bacterium]|nr:ketol-acid reductoisomerase [Pseudomonadota bacterium]